MTEANVFENIPVVLACEKEFIAVPLQVLVKESAVFKSMLSENWCATMSNLSLSSKVSSGRRDQSTKDKYNLSHVKGKFHKVQLKSKIFGDVNLQIFLYIKLLLFLKC